MNNKEQTPETSQLDIGANELVAQCMEAIEHDDLMPLGQIVKTSERANWQLTSCPRYDRLHRWLSQLSGKALQCRRAEFVCNAERDLTFGGIFEMHWRTGR